MKAKQKMLNIKFKIKKNNNRKEKLIVPSLMISKLKTLNKFMMNIIFLILINIEMTFLLLKRNL